MNGRFNFFIAPKGELCRLEIGGEYVENLERIVLVAQRGKATKLRLTLAGPSGVAITRRYKVVEDEG